MTNSTGQSRPLLYVVANIRGQVESKTRFYNDIVCASLQDEILSQQYTKVKDNIESYLDLWERRFDIDYIESVEFHKAQKTNQKLDKITF